MKILFVTDLYPLGNEKIAKALFYFVREWKKQGHDIDVIRPNFVLNTLIRNRKIVEEKIYFEEGVKIFNLNFYSPFWFDVYKKLPGDFYLKDYDVLISHMPCGALFANKLLKKEKIKYVCSFHASDIAVLTKPYYSLFFANAMKKAYFNADKISARSPVLKEKFIGLFPSLRDKVFIASSGLDDELINVADSEKIFNKEYTSIVTVASLIKRKNIDLILKALSKLKIRNFIFKVIGDGKEINNLKKLTEKLNLENNVIFLEYLSRNDVIKELKKSDLFILISKNETFGLSYLEAMATGNIVIGKKNDGIDGIIQNGYNGFLVNDNADELTSCTEKILNLDINELSVICENSINTVKNYKQSVQADNYIKNII